MNSQALQRRSRGLPDSPGVYFFRDKRRKILYIGRATSLRSRVRSYFRGDLLETRGPWVARMLSGISGIDYRKTDSVLEAILLEADLIKKWKPPYNTELKDDKSFNCIAITDEPFPKVSLVRQQEIEVEGKETKNYKLKTIFGPFPHGRQLKTAFKIIRHIFPWRDEKCTPCPEHRKSIRHSNILKNVGMCRPCFNRQIGLCPGVCTGEMTQGEYGKHIRRLCLFLSGRKNQILKELEREMKAFANRQEFEKAGERKRTIFALRHIQDVALLRATNNQQSTTNGRIEAYDLSHFGGKEIVGAMSVVEDGVSVPSEYRLFRIKSVSQAHEVAGLSEILRRRFAHSEWPFPELIVVDGNEVQKKAAEEELKNTGHTVSVIAVVKDEKHRPQRFLGDAEIAKGRRTEILLANSEAHRFVLSFQRRRRVLA